MRKADRRIASAPMTQFAVHIADRPGTGPEVTVFGELDAATGPQLRRMFDRAVEGEGDVLIDLRACGFIDSYGIGVLAGAAVRLQEDDRTLVIRGARPRVARIFELAGLASQDSIVLEPA